MMFPPTIPAWLRFTAFQKTHRYSMMSWLVALSHYFDVRPRYWYERIVLQRKIRGTPLPLIGHLHIPKTGGNYTDSIQDILPHLNLGHTLIRRDRSDRFCPVGLMPMKPGKVKHFFLFCGVRNPLRFLVSYYHHAGGEWTDQSYPNPDFYDYDLAKQGFEPFIREILNRSDPWPSGKFLFPTLFDDTGSCLVDWVNRIEELDEDLARLAEHFGQSYQPGVPQNVSNRPKPVEAYYSDALVEDVKRVYHREMTLLGYDGFGLTQPLLNLHPLRKDRLTYDYRRDELRLDGEVLTR